MAKDKEGYFINDTGKTIQALVNELREGHKGEKVVLISFKPEGEKRDIWLYRGGAAELLSGDDIRAIDSDEIVFCNDLIDGLNKPASTGNRKLKEIRPDLFGESHEGESLADGIDTIKAEPTEPINDITDIFKDYNK